MSSDGRGFRTFHSGPTGSGKTFHCWHNYVRHAPRKLTLEVVAETHRLDASAVRTYGYQETVAQLADCATLTRWHVIAALDPDEIERLFWVFCPKLGRDVVSYAKAVGGMAVFASELSWFAGTGLSTSSPVKRAYLQGRHHWLSMHGATQHISDTDPCTRMQAEYCVFFKQVDDLGLNAVKRASSAAVAERVAELPLYHSLTWVRAESRAYVAGPDFVVYDVFDYRGERIASRATAGALAGVTSSAGRDTSVTAAKGIVSPRVTDARVGLSLGGEQ